MYRRISYLLAAAALAALTLASCAEGTPTTVDAGGGSDADDAMPFDIIQGDGGDNDAASCPGGCPSDLTCCNGECVNTLASKDHCGGCGTTCAQGPNGEAPLCDAGECTIECPDGTGNCDNDPSNGCETTTDTAEDCGACDNQCGAGSSCVGGTCECTSDSCQCQSGLSFCNSNCVDPTTNESHCGRCNNDCPSNSECVGGNCQCESGFRLCNGSCVPTSSYCSPGDTDRETRSCGSCGGQESRERDCLSTCQWSTWSNWSACSVQNCCGDGTCSGGEDCSSCPNDCGACTSCGDGSCNGNETCSTCSTDCGSCVSCGDGSCNGNETCSTCSTDCGSCNTCGDGTCSGSETCSTCSDCQYGHQTTQVGSNGEPCSAPEEHWRCINSTNFGTTLSQVCRNGAWVNFNTSPSNCAACVCDYSSACAQ